MEHRHVLIVTYPAQGHINPASQFSKKLLHLGIQVTFVTTISAFNRMSKASGAAAASGPKGLNFAPFSDGFDDGFKMDSGIDAKEYMSGFERAGSNTLKKVIHTSAENGCPVTCLVYTMLLPWAATVARACHIPSALLWIQPATVVDTYYYYFHGYEDEVQNLDLNDPTWSIQFPGLPMAMKSRDLPSFMLPASDPKYNFALAGYKQQSETLDEEEKPIVLVNTFDALEPEALKAVQSYNMIAVGPLTPSSFLDADDTSFGSDLFQKSNDYREWLDSKDVGSVIYVSFGSILTLPKQQMEEIASGLLKTGRPFLWVIRAKEDGEEETEDDKLSCMEELEQKGMIVPWCSQLEVLTHSSLGCFMTHCGWNSALESIVFGVPVIAFPQYSEQGTNAKLIENVWRTGVRVRPNEEGTIERDEIVRCVEVVMDESGELRNNVKKWKELASEAMQEGGSSDKNLNAFLEKAGEMLAEIKV